ncbi:MAG: dephospho-CoA kinase [Planctomycetota bacterium]
MIGLLGGVGSGKSTLAELFARRGLTVLDADVEARSVLEEATIRSALAERFGETVLQADGSVDRPALAGLAFADARATADLNAIVHPKVRERLLAALDAAGSGPVVLDVPLLLESPLADRVTTWVYLDTPEAVRERRVASRRWAPGERERREARQAALADKRRRADYVLENQGSIEDLERQVDALLRQLDVT